MPAATLLIRVIRKANFLKSSISLYSDMQSVFVLADEVTGTKSKSAGRSQPGNNKPKPPRDPLPGARKPSANPAAETM